MTEEIEISTIDVFNFFHASRDLCLLMIIFANALDPDQNQQNVGPDLDPNRLTP